MMEENNKETKTEQENGSRRMTSAERQALYADRAASRSRSRLRRKRRKRTVIIIAAVLLLAAAAAGIAGVARLYKTKIIPGRKYDEAVALAAEEKYFEAADILISIGDYSDAKELADGYLILGAKKVSGLDDPLILTSAEAPWFSVTPEGELSFNKDVYRGDGNVRIPAVFDRVPVTAIAERFFFYADYLLSVEIPMTVKKIGDRAFLSCTSLTSVTIPDSVTQIGGNVFSGCTALSEVNFGTGLKSIGDRAFKKCESLTSIVFPEGLESIGPYAFNGCVGLTAVSLPASLQELANFAFTGCEAIAEVTYAGTRAELEQLCSGSDGEIILNADKIITSEN